MRLKRLRYFEEAQLPELWHRAFICHCLQHTKISQHTSKTVKIFCNGGSVPNFLTVSLPPHNRSTTFLKHHCKEKHEMYLPLYWEHHRRHCIRVTSWQSCKPDMTDTQNERQCSKSTDLTAAHEMH